MERQRELHGHERTVVVNAVETWSGRKARPEAAVQQQHRPVSMPPQRKAAPEFPKEAEKDAE